MPGVHLIAAFALIALIAFMSSPPSNIFKHNREVFHNPIYPAQLRRGGHSTCPWRVGGWQVGGWVCGRVRARRDQWLGGSAVHDRSLVDNVADYDARAADATDRACGGTTCKVRQGGMQGKDSMLVAEGC